MRVLVTGGAGFIGSHFVKRLVAGGDDVVVLDKLTYAGNPANLDGVGVELVVGDIADPDAVGRAAPGCDAIVNFAAETHVDRSILGPKEFVSTEEYGAAAPRPSYSVLRSEHPDAPALPHWREGLRECLKRLGD